MKDFVARMVDEHSELVTRIDKLADYVYKNGEKEDKIEFANKAIQLSAMRKYEEALRARLENQGIVFADGTYFEKVGEVPEYVLACDLAQNAERKGDQVEHENHE